MNTTDTTNGQAAHVFKQLVQGNASLSDLESAQAKDRNWQESLVSDKPTTILAASFYNASGELIECYQLVTSGKAIAIADYRAGKLERFDASAPRNFVAERWLADLRRNNPYTPRVASHLNKPAANTAQQ